MAASRETVRKVMEVIRRHVDKQTEEKILTDLLKIEGNASFRETIMMLCHEADRRDGR